MNTIMTSTSHGETQNSSPVVLVSSAHHLTAGREVTEMLNVAIITIMVILITCRRTGWRTLTLAFRSGCSYCRSLAAADRNTPYCLEIKCLSLQVLNWLTNIQSFILLSAILNVNLRWLLLQQHWRPHLFIFSRRSQKQSFAGVSLLSPENPLLIKFALTKASSGNG